jgi:hypothetical protein
VIGDRRSIAAGIDDPARRQRLQLQLQGRTNVACPPQRKTTSEFSKCISRGNPSLFTALYEGISPPGLRESKQQCRKARFSLVYSFCSRPSREWRGVSQRSPHQRTSFPAAASA